LMEEIGEHGHDGPIQSYTDISILSKSGTVAHL
jgi:hypothetical protein